jgi:hypothetical protein
VKALWCLVVAGCIDPIDAQWQLDHDHVVAARATPPHIPAGGSTALDALVAHAGGPTTVESPLGATTPQGTMRDTAGTWTFIAPTGSTPTQIDVLMTFADGKPAEVQKTVWIGEPTTNPTMPPITVGGAPADDRVSVALDRDVYLSTTVPSGWHVNWLTSVGTLYEDDEPTSYLHVQNTDRQTGELACVIRDDQGGVVWQVWPLSTQ